MKRSLLIASGIAACLSLSYCKSKKIMVEQPPAAETNAGNRAEEMQKELPDTKVEEVDEGLKLTFDSNILFELNSSYLTPAAHKQLQDLAQVLKKQSYSSIRIEGHTDDTGTEEYNKWLSERRAESVKKFLESQEIPASRMQTSGEGESRPIAPNSTPEGRAQNRRVEVLILN